MMVLEMDLKMPEKLELLRKLLADYGVDAYLQPVQEYPPACNRRVEWLTGFAGSAGLVIVIMDKAALLTDGRYILQAGAQIPAVYEVHNSADITAQQWLKENLPHDTKIGYDPKLYTRKMLEKLPELIPISNPIDQLWTNRPPSPATPIFIHDLKYSGETAQSKRQRIAEIIKKSGADAAFLSSPESVNWLLNIRARDVANTPLCLANAIIDASGKVTLFVDARRVSANLREHLGDDVTISSPLDNSILWYDKKILFSPHNLSVFLADFLEKSGVILQDGDDPCILPKAIKNSVEIAGMKACHIRDGVAVTKLLCWLDRQENISELEVCEKLLQFREANDLFVETSFDTIAGSGEHGAIVHYRATSESNRILQNGELFLLDSGGQYYDGTTDITRTVAIGEPNSEHKIRFTQVLKGHIALASAIFPEGTVGSQLDALARQFLWQEGLDYDHGTGHGVGCFLGVHEAPQRISKRGNDAKLAAGMVISNEPAYYKQGEYGIRIESLVAVVKTLEKSLKFETLTCVPIDTRLIDFSMLSDVEKNWINDYHAWVISEISPFLDANEQIWLKHSCKTYSASKY